MDFQSTTFSFYKFSILESMGERQRRGSHTVSWLTVHLVFVTKYRKKVLKGDIQRRVRSLLIQICESEDVQILKGVVSKDHVHMHVEFPPKVRISDLVKRLKGRSSRRIQDEFPALRKQYWGRHFWAIGYGAWSTGNITDKMVDAYLEHHWKDKGSDDRMILE